MKIAVVSALKNEQDWYSVNGVIRNQVGLLVSFGHKVTLFTRRDYTGRGVRGADLKSILPDGELVNYKSVQDIRADHLLLSEEGAKALFSWLPSYDVVMTHDVMQLGWHLPYALAIRKVSKHITPKWFHWIHSKPVPKRDWWESSVLFGDHTFVYPNATDLPLVSTQFNTESVAYVPHTLDLKDFFSSRLKSSSITDLFPQMMSADIVQVYPAATDRFDAKGVRDLIVLFSQLKKMGQSVFLLVVNQWSDKRSRKFVDPIAHLEKIGRRNGLDPYVDFAFTSEILKGKYQDGVPHGVLLDLFKCSNLFVYPSQYESFGLVLLEAVLSGGVLPVLNTSVPMFAEVFGNRALYHDFGSDEPEGPRLTNLASDIIEWLSLDKSVSSKTLVRGSFNPEVVYKKYYRSLLGAG